MFQDEPAHHAYRTGQVTCPDLKGVHGSNVIALAVCLSNQAGRKYDGVCPCKRGTMPTRKGYDKYLAKTQARLQAAPRSPRPEQPRQGINELLAAVGFPNDDQAWQIIRHLCIRYQDQKMYPEPSPGKDRKALAAIKKAAATLLQKINSLSEKAADRLWTATPPDVLITPTYRALGALLLASASASEGLPQGVGRPRVTALEDLVRDLAYWYRSVHGRWPGYKQYLGEYSGGFVDFVHGLLSCFGDHKSKSTVGDIIKAITDELRRLG